MVEENLIATLDGDNKKLTNFKDYLVQITVDVPYPKTFEFRESATSISPAVSRALKEVRKKLNRKKIKQFKIIATKL